MPAYADHMVEFNLSDILTKHNDMCLAQRRHI